MQVVLFFLMAHTRVKNGWINALLYRMGLPSNTATPLPLFWGNLRKEQNSSYLALFVRIELSCQRVAELKLDMFSSEQRCSGLVIYDNRESKASVLQTLWMVFAPPRLESCPTYGWMDTRIEVIICAAVFVATHVCWRTQLQKHSITMLTE